MHIMPGGRHGYPDSSEYSGPLRESDGVPQGTGTLTLPDGSQYTGQFQEGMYNGLGALVCKDGSRYEGEFVNGLFHGVGVFRRSNGLVYQGEFSAGKISGRGLMTFADGTSGQPRQEGVFEYAILKRREKCQSIVDRARHAAQQAQSLQGGR